MNTRRTAQVVAVRRPSPRRFVLRVNLVLVSLIIVLLLLAQNSGVT